MCKCAQFAGKGCKGAECWANVPTETVTFDTEQVSLPTQIILPLPVANQSHSARRLTLNETPMLLPVRIVEWLQEYHGNWLLEVTETS